MGKLIINSFSEFQTHTGLELGVSNYHKVTQEQINKFADATLDHQWIHVDPERAKKESPYGSTIAHGYLSVSLLPYLWDQIIQVNNIKMLVNYGMENLKFKEPVKVGDEVRVRTSLRSIVDLRGPARAKIDCILEIKDSKKPAFTATVIFVYHFNK